MNYGVAVTDVDGDGQYELVVAVTLTHTTTTQCNGGRNTAQRCEDYIEHDSFATL
jgi:hypothetical protein